MGISDRGWASYALHYERYADDFIVLATDKKNAEAAKNHLGNLLKEKLKMDLSEAKTHITDLHEGFDFLGHRIWRDESSAACRLAPTQKKMTELVEDLTNLAKQEKHAVARDERARDRVGGFIDYYYLVAKPEKELLLKFIEDTLRNLGLRPTDESTDCSNTMTQKFAS